MCQTPVAAKDAFTVRHFTVCSRQCLKMLRETQLKIILEKEQQAEADLSAKRRAQGLPSGGGGHGPAAC